MILEVKHVKKFFGSKKVLDDINFTLDAGECLGIVGLSGCGKSTLAKIIARLIDCDGGKIFLCGEDIMHANDNNFYRNMQMIFQMPEDFSLAMIICADESKIFYRKSACRKIMSNVIRAKYPAANVNERRLQERFPSSRNF